MRFILLPLAIILISGLPLAAENGDKKVALVIGNSDYSAGPLRNPANDAADMSLALRRLGFTVYSGTDASRKTMYSLIDRFGDDIRGADIALFYYSGHGIQMEGENYLIPVGAAVSIAEDVETEGVQLQRIIGRMNAGGAGTNIVILDACRDNPFPSAAKGMERGLAVVGQKPPQSVIVYATEAGETAADGGGRNGVFTAALLKHIGENVELTTVLHEVSADVREATGQKQKPARYDNLDHEVWLAGRARAVAAPPPSEGRAASAAEPTVTITRSYGSLVVSSATAGSLYLDGAAMGDFPAGAETRLDNVEAGNHSLELRYSADDKETKSVSVKKGQSTSVSFAMKISPKGIQSSQAYKKTSATDSGIPRDGLVGEWLFSGSAKDSSGNGNDGAVHEAKLAADRFGKPESAYLFNGKSSFIDVMDSNTLGINTGFSACFWVFQNTDDSSAGIIDKETPGIGDGYMVDFYTNRVRFCTDYYSFSNTVMSTMIRKWCFVAISWDGQTIRYYINGKADGSSGKTTRININTLGLRIGARYSGIFFGGLIDDIRLYDRALSAEEIQALYHEGGWTGN
jgi:hypothetical protein